MKRKLLCLGMAVMMACSGLSGVTAYAQEAQTQLAEEQEAQTTEDVDRTGEAYGDFEYTELQDGALQIIGYYGSEEEPLIPTQIDGKQVSSIGGTAFRYCRNIKHIALPEGITEIEKNALYNCSGLRSISFPASLEKIERGSGINSVEISGIFYGCTSLENIEVAEENTEYASEDGVLYNKEKTELLYCPLGKNSIVIPESVVTIKSIGSGLTDIMVAEGNTHYASEDGALFNKDKTTLIFCPEEKDSIVLPKSVVSISSSNIFNCLDLNIILADGNEAFILEDGMLYNRERTLLIRCQGKKKVLRLYQKV